MKKLLMICLLAGYGHCIAQNVGLKELLRVMEPEPYTITLRPINKSQKTSAYQPKVKVSQTWLRFD